MSQEAWLNAKWINSIRSPYMEKTSKMWSKYPINSESFERSHRVGWLDWADSYCIESGFFMHKFRLHTKYILKTYICWLIWCWNPNVWCPQTLSVLIIARLLVNFDYSYIFSTSSRWTSRALPLKSKNHVLFDLLSMYSPWFSQLTSKLQTVI